MKILLLQARDADDPMLHHELMCFAKRCHLDTAAFATLNLAADPIEESALDGVEAVMVGGSGDYSLVKGGFDWHEDYLRFMRQVLDHGVPTFASCFGFQALVQALGGTVHKERSAAEVGTFELRLTDAGTEDPFFSQLDETFDVQLGHNDSAHPDLPGGLVNMASTQRCEVQAIRVSGRPVVATQFHPELSMEDNIVRYIRYLHAYDPGLDDEEARLQAERIHRPSPVANSLLRKFLDAHTGKRLP